jgi:hypothetical protein
MTDEKFCSECGMSFDWPGITARGEEYCCQACSIGEECTCPQHSHQDAAAAPGAGRWGGSRTSTDLKL